MATCTSVCAVCDLRYQSTPSTHWCIYCEEPLCTDCREYHNVLKATKSHKTIHLSEYQLLPNVVIDNKQNCVYHNEMYQLYCTKHESPICSKCVKDHWKCGEILSLEEVVRDIKTSEFFVDLEQSLDDLFGYIIQIRKDRESNIETITYQKEKIAAHVCHIKKQVIKHVNQLEEEFIKELDQIEYNICNPIRLIVSSLRDQERKINQMKSEIENTKKYASDLQCFLSTREIQAKTTEYEKHLQISDEYNNHIKINIESAIDTKIHDILTVGRFCSIKVKQIPSTNIELHKRKDRQAKMIVHKARKSINNVKLVFERKLETACNYTFGCCITKNGDFLFTFYEDNNGKVKAINAVRKVDYTIPLIDGDSAYDTMCLDNSTIAVSTGSSTTKPGISIVDLTKREVLKFIDLPGSSYGITYDGKSLICCVKDKDLHVIYCTDYSITTIPNTVTPEFSFVSTYADKIYFTNPDKHKVTCCLYSGAQVWELTDERVLYSPRGITTDNYGNVFVAGTKSRNVVIISPDGKQFKQILTKEDGLGRPYAIYFDKVKKQLLVTNFMQFAHIYNFFYF